MMCMEYGLPYKIALTNHLRKDCCAVPHMQYVGAEIIQIWERKQNPKWPYAVRIKRSNQNKK